MKAIPKTDASVEDRKGEASVYEPRCPVGEHWGAPDLNCFIENVLGPNRKLRRITERDLDRPVDKPCRSQRNQVEIVLELLPHSSN